MVLNYMGKGVEEGDITRQITKEFTGLRGYSGGTTFYQMQKIAVELYGLPTFLISNCDLYSLKSAIANGWPPVIGYKSRGRSYHAVVTVGYNDKRNIMMVHDPNYVRVKEIRYYDLGGVREDSIQRISCMLVLPEGSTTENLKRGLEKYISKDLVNKLRISPMIPVIEK
jgi:hypothetical protein